MISDCYPKTISINLVRYFRKFLNVAFFVIPSHNILILIIAEIPSKDILVIRMIN